MITTLPNQFLDKIESLVFKVQKRIGKPMNVNVVQATIESFGIREKDVVIDYGFETIEELSKIVFQDLLSRTNTVSYQKIEQTQTQLTKTDIKKFLKDFAIGIAYVSPIFFQVICVILFGYSLWVYSYFNILQSTSVVVGVITSLVFTGGIITVISKQISFFWNYNNHKMLFQYTVYLIIVGLKILLLCNATLILLSLLLGIFSIEMAVLSAIYSITIGIALLFTAPLYVFKQRITISLSIIIGTLLSLTLKFFTSIDIYLTHWLGILTVILILGFSLIRYFKNIKSYDKNLAYNDVKKEFIVYNNYIYFIYGTLFFVYVFLDRIIAWSVNEQVRFSYFIFFEKDYEIGMDIALITYLLVAGVFEFAVFDFAKRLDTLQTEVAFNKTIDYGNHIKKRYLNNMMLLLLTSCMAFGIQLFILYSKYGYNAIFEEKLNAININVCLLGSLGYFFFSCSVLNVLYFFTLGHPLKPLKGIFIAFFINLMIGLFFSRSVSYEWSVLGFLIGSIAFMIYTSVQLRNFFKHLDYYYYASF